MLPLLLGLWAEVAVPGELVEASSPDVAAGCGTVVMVSSADGPRPLTRWLLNLGPRFLGGIL